MPKPSRIAAASAPVSLNNNSTSAPGPRPIIVTGPTGVGKSSFAVALAERVGGEIIGADAFQIYACLPILTSQPAAGLQSRVPHHLIGVVSSTESCDAARYAAMARAKISEVVARGVVPILVGGTGLYLKALTHGLADLPPVDPELRARISEMDLATALAQLGEADADAPGLIDCRNPVRVRRALEIVLSSGRPLAQSRETWGSARGEFSGLVLVRDRDELRRRIEENVDAMLRGGAIEEVRESTDIGPAACRAIGFAQIQAFLCGESSWDECRSAIISATWRYAKRQLTWCRNQFNFSSINLTATPDPIEAATTILAQPSP